MSTQTDMFTYGPRGVLRPLARNQDPGTSHKAERELRRSGKLTRQSSEVLELLREYIDRTRTHPTAAELAGGTESKLHGKCRRRLPDLREQGFVENDDPRRCAITGSTAITWKLVVT